MAEPVNGTVLAKAMRGAPDRSGYDYALELLGEAFTPAREFAQAMAGMVSPSPRSLGAAGVAGIRSMLPGSGTYQQELDRYNQAAAPQDSVTDIYPMPSEDPWEFAKRANRSPQNERQIMQASSMAAPMVVRGRAGFSRFTNGGLLSDESLGARSEGSAFRGITEPEMQYIDATGKIQSNESWSAAGEGTNFADNLADAASYASFGSTNPSKTGVPTYAIEIPSSLVFRAPDGYLKTNAGIPASNISAMWRFNPDGTVDVGEYVPPSKPSR